MTGGSSILVTRMYPIEKAREVFARALHVNVHLASVDEKALDQLRGALASEKGRCPVYLDFDYATGEKIKIEAGPDLRVRCTDRLLSRVEEILGKKPPLSSQNKYCFLFARLLVSARSD